MLFTVKVWEILGDSLNFKNSQLLTLITNPILVALANGWFELKVYIPPITHLYGNLPSSMVAVLFNYKVGEILPRVKNFENSLVSGALPKSPHKARNLASKPIVLSPRLQPEFHNRLRLK
jgi:hypothetical protein